MSTSSADPVREDRLAGTLLGMAVGDALGLPREGLSARRARRLFGAAPLSHRLVLGRGMTSDDTEHACMTAQALLASGGEVSGFARSLAWRLRWWLVGLPAGIGWGTLRSIVRLWAGVSPARSGVRSAGNGPAMRAPILGAALANDATRREALVRASTALTHDDERARAGASIVALAAALAVQAPAPEPQAMLARLRAAVSEPELCAALALVEELLLRGAPPSELANRLGLAKGVTGYMPHTVALSLYCWLRYPSDLRRAVEEVILLGGDTDTTAAIVGGLAGASLGAAAIPAAWIDGVCEWPRTTRWLQRLAERLASRFPLVGTGAPARPLALCWPALALRNAAFVFLVLAVGLRRLLPPY